MTQEEKNMEERFNNVKMFYLGEKRGKMWVNPEAMRAFILSELEKKEKEVKQSLLEEVRGKIEKLCFPLYLRHAGKQDTDITMLIRKDDLLSSLDSPR